MNIKGEDCKDGQDGQKGNNGSSSSNGKLLGQIRYFLLKMVILKHLLVVFFLAIQEYLFCSKYDSITNVSWGVQGKNGTRF